MTNRFHSRFQKDLTGDDWFLHSSIIGPEFNDQPIPAAEFAPIVLPARPSAAPLTPTLYVTEAGDPAAICVSDINQGQLGDCFLLSAFGELALFHPSAISSMIHDNGNATETVTLYLDKNGRMPSFSSNSFNSTPVTVNNTFTANCVNNGATQDVAGNLKEIWPQVVEKAFATLGGGMSSIASGGYPVLALEGLTGHVATSMAPAKLTLAVLTAEIAAGDLIVMDTASRPRLPYGLVSNHAYMFEKLIGSGNSATVQLHNPWGFNQPAAIPLIKLAQSGIVEVDIGHA